MFLEMVEVVCQSSWNKQVQIGTLWNKINGYINNIGIGGE